MAGYVVKTYLVLQRMNVPTPEGFNLRVLGVFLTHDRAQELVDAMPGTFIQKFVAKK